MMTTEADFCYYHPYDKAMTSCERCNRPLCSNCLYTFKDPSVWTYSYREEYDDSIPDLHWCHPCYFDHFNPEITRNASLTFQLFISFFNGFILFIMIIFLISGLSSAYKIYYNTPDNYIVESVTLYIISFIIFFMLNRNIVIKKEKDFTEFKENHFFNLNLSDIVFPIECYYCKEAIRHDSLTCLNIKCSLGENIEENIPIIELEPIKYNGIFDTLNELPKNPKLDE